ncbi:hypothetical protein KFE80_08430 [bacterium SCSIO 12696]|nr:hypothetical protein KFE80_08430 [bacterium SCSIO 12696]
MKNPVKVLSAPLLVSFLIGGSQMAHAGAWVGEKGSGYHKIAYNAFDADDFFGDNDGFENFQNDSISYYFETGLGNKLALFGSLSLQDLEQTISGQETSSSGLSDLELGLRYSLVDSSAYVLSAAFTFKAPYLYDEDDDLPRGNGQEDYEGRLLFGKSLNKYGYFGAELGYRLRSGTPSDEIRYLLEYGFNATENLYFRTKLDGTESANNASVFLNNNGNLSTPQEFDLGKWELTAGWNFGKPGRYGRGKYGIEFTYTKDVYGDNTLDGETFQIGITYSH